ncbi:MAG: hypothetical protein WC758_06890 [Candidatus Woesearchaeota archaeon]|jgi:FKBP-type peptidyl-prolyl cis-trans isomerase SlyD
MNISKGDFIELDYTAKIVDENIVFDTTEFDEAKKAGLFHDHANDEPNSHNHNHNHLHKDDLKPITICVGEKHVLPGLDSKLIGLDLGKHTIVLEEENAFGKKDTKLLKLMTRALFKQQNIRPYVGLVLDMDGSRGTVRSISGGRVIVDFNHPLAGKKIEYSLNIKRKVTDHKDQLASILKMIKFPFSSVDVVGLNAKINTKIDLPKEVKLALETDLKRLTTLNVELISEPKIKDDKK